MSTASHVKETYELTGDDARETLMSTGRIALMKDAIVRLRAADGTSHSRGLAFAVSLVLVQGLVVVVGFAVATGSAGFRQLLLDTIQASAPGPTSDLLTNAVEQATHVGRRNRYLPLTIGLIGTLRHGDGHHGSARARDEPHLRHREGSAVRGEVQARLRARGERRRHDRRVVHAARIRPRSRRERGRSRSVARPSLADRHRARCRSASRLSFAGRRSDGSPDGPGSPSERESASPAGRSSPGCSRSSSTSRRRSARPMARSPGSSPSSSGPSSRLSPSSTASPLPHSSKRCGRACRRRRTLRKTRRPIPSRSLPDSATSDVPTRGFRSACSGNLDRTHVPRRSWMPTWLLVLIVVLLVLAVFGGFGYSRR